MAEDNVTKIELKQAYGLTVMARGNSNHWVVMDGPEAFNGHSAAARPMELLLMGLAGCTSQDVISILDKMKVKYRDYKLEITAERAPNHPKVYTKIHLKYMIWGNVPEDKFKTAIELSETKYCSASAMLKKAADVSYEYVIYRDDE
jgi:putative redox protein